MPGKCDFSKCMFEGELKVLWELGHGSHGDVLLVRDCKRQKFAVKTASGGSFTVKLLEHEYKIYQHLQCDKKKITGLPQIFKYGFDHLHDKYVLVMSRLGASLRDVMKLNRAPIPEYAALRIGCQLVRRLQYVHAMGLVHGDIKPRNILCGHETFEKVYIVDYGLSTFYKHRKSGKHHRMITGQRFKGTKEFASRNAHKGFSLSRRDDLESLGFSLIYMMRGNLPWSKSLVDECQSCTGIVENEVEPADTKSKSRNKADVKVVKENTSIEALCAGLPSCMSAYMRYVYGLAFEESPDYSLLIKVIEERIDELKRMGGEDNGNELVIWTVPFEKSVFMRIRLEKEVWAEIAEEKDAEGEGNDKENCQNGELNAPSHVDAIEQRIPDAKNEVSCNPFRCLRESKKPKVTFHENAKEGSELSSVQPHPVLHRTSQKWWTCILAFLRNEKPLPETVLLHYSDEGVHIETEQQEW